MNKESFCQSIAKQVENVKLVSQVTKNHGALVEASVRTTKTVLFGRRASRKEQEETNAQVFRQKKKFALFSRLEAKN